MSLRLSTEGYNFLNRMKGGVVKRYMSAVQAGLLISLTVVIFTQPLWADSGPDHQQKQSRPIMLGVSGGPIDDLTTKLFGTVVCCVGTLGGLVTDGGSYFILSNNHVLAKTNSGVIGDDIVQPGLADANCEQISGDIVANLSDFESISFSSNNTIDAAIAEVVPGQVDMSGSILDIGQPSSTPVTPAISMKVKKSGRTTGLTQGTIAAINVTINVSYPKGGRCGAFFLQTATFTNQIRIVDGSFSAGGDSGSLIVEDVDSCPRPVGLLFAGSDTETFANPISDVFNTFGVTGVGCQ
jgi:hypothetical protein